MCTKSKHLSQFYFISQWKLINIGTCHSSMFQLFIFLQIKINNVEMHYKKQIIMIFPIVELENIAFVSSYVFVPAY